MLFKSTGIVNNVLNEFFCFSSELIVNRILIVSIVVNKIFSSIKKLIIIIIIIINYHYYIFIVISQYKTLECCPHYE